ncbi:MAG: RNA-binding S4 domain-containing protein [Bacteroidia bacterium]|jgi:ribosome-associated protein|nr:RNA-binding S4 domain-containing protein [Bacteroidia bacterium]
MKKEVFEIEGEYIELIQLLKVLNIAETGGQAKWLVEEGNVKLNGEVEYRKRAKLRNGDVVICSGVEVSIVGGG